MNAILALRNKLGQHGKPLSREKLAQLLGASLQTVTKWEIKNQRPDPERKATKRLKRLLVEHGITEEEKTDETN